MKPVLASGSAGGVVADFQRWFDGSHRLSESVRTGGMARHACQGLCSSLHAPMLLCLHNSTFGSCRSKQLGLIHVTQFTGTSPRFGSRPTGLDALPSSKRTRTRGRVAEPTCLILRARCASMTSTAPRMARRRSLPSHVIARSWRPWSGHGPTTGEWPRHRSPWASE